MYYTEKIQLKQAEDLLGQCGLSMPEGVELTVGVFDDADNSLAATGSLKGDMLQGMAVDPARQGEDLTARVLTALISEAKDARSLYLFTKPEKAMQFSGLGFRLIAKARPYAALLEWGEDRVGHYRETLESVRRATGLAADAQVGALVMNCNPFTKGHRYLIEQAAETCDHVFVLVVEEDRSRFPFCDRLKLVQQGTTDLANVTVIGGGRYAVSELTFPSYFTKDDKVADAHAAMDAELFAAVIAPALGVSKRFLGTEPKSPVTHIYNETLKKRLPKHGIEAVEIPRLELGDEPVSASRVRVLLDAGDEAAWQEIEGLVPETTYAYLQANARTVTLQELLDGREARASHQRELLKKDGGILVSMTLNIPGPVKDKELYRKALEQGMGKLEEAIGNAATKTGESQDNGMVSPEKSLEKTTITHREIRHPKTGSEGFLVVKEGVLRGEDVKKIAMMVEDADDFGRILDIDVMTETASFSRKDFGGKPRRCLVCGEDAKICARGQKHDMETLIKKIEEILQESVLF